MENGGVSLLRLQDAPQYQRVKPDNKYAPNPDRFEGEPTSKADYKAWEVQKYSRYGPQTSTNVPLKSLVRRLRGRVRRHSPSLSLPSALCYAIAATLFVEPVL